MSMDNDKSSSTAGPTTPGDELLHEMMPKLGLEAKGPTGRYKNQAWARYFLPRVLILELVLLLVATLVILLLLPVRFHDVSLSESPVTAELRFRLDRPLLFENVTATLDGRPLTLTSLGKGVYRVNADKNGQLTVVTSTFTSRHASMSITIDCIDDDPPSVASHQVLDGFMYIYLSDGDASSSSGVNWRSVQAYFTGSGKPVEGAEIDEQAGYVRFPFPDESVRIYAEDNSGNPISLRLDRPQSGE